MSRDNLLDSEYHFSEKLPKEGVIAAIWAFFTVVFIAAALVFFYFSFSIERAVYNVLPMAGEMIGIILAAMLGLYLLLKFIVTLLFCDKKKNGVKLQILANKGVPICSCKEAFRIWQIVLMYMIPLVLTHSSLLLLGYYADGEPGYFIILTFMSFFMSLDLALVIYVIYLQIKHKPDYISVNHHVYDITLYNKAYVRRRKRSTGI